jgi:glycosyltransferase involved in cell wall biosynthesis
MKLAYAKSRSAGIQYALPRLSIVVPAHNEAARLPETLPKLAQFCERHGSVELLIVDDGSKDDTAAVVRKFASEYPFAGNQACGRYRGNFLPNQNVRDIGV